MRSILYLHGFCASSQSVKAKMVQQALNERHLAHLFCCPDLSFHPQQALHQVLDCIEKNPNVGLIGSSLGGHYASVAAEKYNLPAVLINPAVIDKINLALFVGEHQNWHTSEKFTFTQNDAAILQKQVVVPNPKRYWLLQELADEVLNPQHAQEWFLGAKTTLLDGGNHHFVHFGHFLPFILDWLWHFETF